MIHQTRALRGAVLIALALSSVTFRAYAAETVVNQLNLKFVPDSVTLKAGDTIRFTNSDHFLHDVTIVNPDGKSDDKGLHNYKEDVVVTFAKTGNYQIHCRLHPAMKMTVTVK